MAFCACRAMVFVSLKASVALPDPDAAAAMIDKAFGAQSASVSNVSLLLESRTLAFAVSTTSGVSVSNEDILGSFGTQTWSSSVRVERATGGWAHQATVCLRYRAVSPVVAHMCGRVWLTTVCGNGLCELGEGCVGSSCNASASLCLQDCPQSSVRCPVAQGLVRFC